VAARVRPGRRRRRLGPTLLAVATSLAAAGCGIGAQVVVTPRPSSAASAAISPTLQLARTEVAGALGAAAIQVRDAQVPYRPAESPRVTAAPRLVVQAVLPAAPDRGFVVLYEFPDPGSATAAAQELATYIASGPGRVQFPNDARFTIRQVGAALVFNAWSPSTSGDPEGEERVATALTSLGQGWDVPR
jgi:hypothetical protein